MDEEDLRELHKMQLVTTEEYSGRGDAAVVAKRPGLGWQMMRRMGWRGEVGEAGPASVLIARGTKQRDVRLEVEDEDEDLYQVAPSKDTFMSSIEVVPTIRGESIGKHFTVSNESCLDGFVPAMEKCLLEAEYPPPLVPEDFTPRGLGLQAAIPEIPRASTVEERAKALGEHYDAIKVLLPETLEGVITELDVTTALAAQRGYMPFQQIPTKDARYRQFLAHFATPDVVRQVERPKGMTMAEFQREQVEFVKAANIYKPLAGSMASKFVSSSKGGGNGGDLPSPVVGLYRPQTKKKEEKEIKPEPTIKVGEPLPYDDSTRLISKWTPSSTLCKLFNVESPSGEDPAGTSTINPVLSLESLQKIVSESKFADKVVLSGEDESINGPKTVDVEITENLERPAMELFKSIFCSDNDEELNLQSQSQSQSQPQSQLFSTQPSLTPLKTESTELVERADSSPGIQTQESVIKRGVAKRKNPPRIVPVTVIEESVEIVNQPKPLPPLEREDELEYADIVTIRKKKSRPDATDFW